MTLRLGYACIHTQLPSPNRTCRLASATPQRVEELARANLSALQTILEWNVAHGIPLFRLTSDLIPLASHPQLRSLDWQSDLGAELEAAGSYARQHDLRLSLHPGQYTVLNSPRPEVVTAAIAELAYSAALLDALGLDQQHKLVLHLGGVYGDKPAALQRFINVYRQLPASVRARLIIENDERSYTLADALAVSQQTGAPVVFDVFHHRFNPSLPDLTLRQQVQTAARTWQPADGRPKLHYSDPFPGKPNGAHSASVDVAAFAQFAAQLNGLDLDVMLEVKDKEQSVLKLQNL